MFKISRQTTRPFLLLASLLFPLGVYLLTACRDIYWMDSAEFVVTSRVFGLVHPPGYPLLTNLFSFATLIPMFQLPFRLNLISAFAAAGSCLVLFLTIEHLTKKSQLALLGCFVWAVSSELWNQATVVEVYSFQVFLFSLALYAALRWCEEFSSGFLTFFAFAFGCGLANHPFIITWLPTFILIISSPVLKTIKPRTWGAFAGALLLGPLLYLSLPFRSQNLFSWGGINSIASFLKYITGNVYRYRFLAGGTNYIINQTSALPRSFFEQFSILGVLIFPGIFWFFKTHRRALGALLLGVVLTTLVTFSYNIPDKEGYFLPVYFILAIFIGSSLALLNNPIAYRASLVALLSLTVGIGVWKYPRQNRSRLFSLSDLAHSISAELPDTAIIFTNDYSVFHALNWQKIEEYPSRPLIVVSEHHLAFPWYLKQISRILPIPDTCFTIADDIWKNFPKMNDINFGTVTAARVEEVKYQMIRRLMNSHRLFYFPQNFSYFPDSWREFRLKMHGLTYEFRPGTDTAIPSEIVFFFPAPEKYSVPRTTDPYTEDMCRRFAATANRRGIFHYALKDVSNALADFNLALQYYPDYPAAIENKGIIFAFEGQSDSARAYLTKFIKLEPNSPEINKIRALLDNLKK